MMNFDARVLIISVYYNREDYITESVESVVSQLSDEDVLLLVDDGSTDNTYSKLKEFERTNVQVLSFKNSGLVNALRKAVDAINSDYIAIHGSGDISLPGRFESQVEELRKDKSVGLVGTWYEDVNVLDGLKTVQKKKVGENAVKTLMKYNPFCHTSVMFRREVYYKVGGYDPFFIFAQDRDLWCRMSHHCKLKMIDKIYVVRYHSLANSVSGDYKKRLRQVYFSAFAVYKHSVDMDDDFSSKEVALYFSTPMKLKNQLFKLSIKYFMAGNNDAVDFYKSHVTSGIGIVYSPFFTFIKLFPNFSCRILNGIKR